MQTSRYILFFILFAKLASKPPYNPVYLIKLFKVQSIVIFFVFSGILLGHFIIKVDAWNELTLNEQSGGGMFLYTGGVGTMGTISVAIVYLCFIHSNGLYKYLMAILISIIFLAILFSGSRQGIMFSSLSFILSILLFRQYKNIITISIVSFVFIVILLNNNAIQKQKGWILRRYDILIGKEIGIKGEINSRNVAIYEAEKEKKDFITTMTGIGLGGKIIPTESDYYNTYSYFGIISLVIYALFIIFLPFKIYLNWRKSRDKLSKQILLLILIIALTIPIFGLQQWYIMTHASSNASNAFLILFLLSYGINNNSQRNITYGIKK